MPPEWEGPNAKLQSLQDSYTVTCWLTRGMTYSLIPFPHLTSIWTLKFLKFIFISAQQSPNNYLNVYFSPRFFVLKQLCIDLESHPERIKDLYCLYMPGIAFEISEFVIYV